jgi:hypothetical protein
LKRKRNSVFGEKLYVLFFQTEQKWNREAVFPTLTPDPLPQNPDPRPIPETELFTGRKEGMFAPTLLTSNLLVINEQQQRSSFDSFFGFHFIIEKS